ncbi:MAG: hypothetical protein ABIA76_05640 [Candidatus Diapherotrites archaeon]
MSKNLLIAIILILLGLVVLFFAVIFISAFFAFGIFNPPSAGTCTGLDKLAYYDHYFDGQTFSIALLNGTGYALEEGNYSARIEGTATDMSISKSGGWELGEQKIFSDSAELTSPVEILITYTVPLGIIHQETAVCSFSRTDLI